MYVKVAHNIDEMLQAFAVRAAVFMNEEFCPYAEEFDGNDFTATQVLGLIEEEPVAAMRIRYFSGFAKLERLAVRREFRKRAVAATIIEYAIELCRQKGYATLQGHAEERLLPFWEKFGFLPMEGAEFDFAGHRFVELRCDLEPHPNPIEMGKDPLLLVRPEGAWAEPCLLEGIAAGPRDDRTAEATDPHWAARPGPRIRRAG